jgi:pilus assembly protein CpaE
MDRSQISTAKAEETIDREIFWRIPNDYSSVSASRNNGLPLLEHAPKAAVTTAIDELARKLEDFDGKNMDAPAEDEAGKEKKSWLGFLSK